MVSRRALTHTILAAALLGRVMTVQAQDGKPHKVVFQVSDADPAKWNLALNNARNVQADLGADQTSIEIVAYGPGIGMLKMDSPTATRVAEALGKGVEIVACENTMRAMRLGREDMLPQIGYVPAGVVEIMARQKQGYAYVRPSRSRRGRRTAPSLRDVASAGAARQLTDVPGEGLRAQLEPFDHGQVGE
jgi:intracellular sulfur oxidation DsrE/DsrF family protein